MQTPQQVPVPSVVRVKEGALDRVGLYLKRSLHDRVLILQSEGLVAPLPDRLRDSLRNNGVETTGWEEVREIAIESALELVSRVPSSTSAIVGIGGGKALDVAKYIATQARLPYFSVPTSLSNDGFCSPQSSLTYQGARRSFPASIPFGLVVDTQVCLQAPKELTLSGIGDLVAKFTAVRDWKLSFHETGEPVGDFAALLSDGSVHAFMNRPKLDTQGMQLLATALMMNGLAMAMCGTSRPASGSEHLISHALDRILEPPRLHGIQVGVATYLMSLVQDANHERIDGLFESTGFWDIVKAAPFSREHWMQAMQLAKSIKQSYYTILSTPDATAKATHFIQTNHRLCEAIV
ncbi:MAG: iron-containing alcohol dehydrogenase family protein [Aureliella sp.]